MAGRSKCREFQNIFLVQRASQIKLSKTRTAVTLQADAIFLLKRLLSIPSFL